MTYIRQRRLYDDTTEADAFAGNARDGSWQDERLERRCLGQRALCEKSPFVSTALCRFRRAPPEANVEEFLE